MICIPDAITLTICQVLNKLPNDIMQTIIVYIDNTCKIPFLKDEDEENIRLKKSINIDQTINYFRNPYIYRNRVLFLHEYKLLKYIYNTNGNKKSKFWVIINDNVRMLHFYTSETSYSSLIKRVR
jgi:hypothetical protein